MSKKSKLIFFAVISIQILLITLLLVHIHYKQSGVLATVAINPLHKEDLAFPQTATLKNYYESKPNSIQNSTPDWMRDRKAGTQTINADGFNERYDYSLEKPANTFRIITLGDSFTFGVFVDTANNYPEQLEDLLNNSKCPRYNNFDIINLGIGGYDVEYAAYRFSEKGAKYSPDLILWFLKVDDFNQIVDQTKQRKKELRSDMEKTGELEKAYSKGNYYPDTQQAVKELLESYSQSDIIKYQMEKLKSFHDRYPVPIVLFTMAKTSKNSLDHILDKSKELDQYIKTTSNFFYFDQLTDLYQVEGASFVDSHPTEKGYSIIAQNLLNYLRSNNIIPCN